MSPSTARPVPRANGRALSAGAVADEFGGAELLANDLLGPLGLTRRELANLASGAAERASGVLNELVAVGAENLVIGCDPGFPTQVLDAVGLESAGTSMHGRPP